MGILAVVNSALDVFTFSSGVIFHSWQHIPYKVILAALIWPFVLFTETFIYWRIRKRIYQKSWTNMHTACMVLALFFMMWFFIPLIILLNRQVKIYNDKIVPWYFFQVRFFVIWGLIIIGHIFFIATIVKSFSKKEVPASEDEPFTTSPDSIAGESAGL